MTQQQFIGAIQEATGKILTEDYGFIEGSRSPYGNSEVASASDVERTPGFKVWKRGEQNIIKNIDNTDMSDKETLNAVINFLNK